MNTYPKGTPVSEIVTFDRSTKVEFECKHHPGPVYSSKQPSCSAWFPRNQQAIDIQNGMAKDPCHHSSADYGVWVTASEYTA